MPWLKTSLQHREKQWPNPSRSFKLLYFWEVTEKTVTLTSISPLSSISYASSVRRALYVAELMWIFCARIQNRALEGKDSPVSGEHTLVLLHYQPSVSTSSLENIRLRKKYKGGWRCPTWRMTVLSLGHCIQMSVNRTTDMTTQCCAGYLYNSTVHVCGIGSKGSPKSWAKKNSPLLCSHSVST